MAKPTIETMYPLTPLQQGMLFHTLYAPHEGMYMQQLLVTLQERTLGRSVSASVAKSY